MKRVSLFSQVRKYPLNCYSPGIMHTINFKYLNYNFLLVWPVKDFPGDSDGKESACNAGDMGSIPGLGRSPREWMATHSSIPVWRSLWTEKPRGLQLMGSQRVGHDWKTNTHTHTHTRLVKSKKSSSIPERGRFRYIFHSNIIITECNCFSFIGGLD